MMIRAYPSPEPMLQAPSFVFVYGMASAWMSVPTYAYGANNPLRYMDPDGRRIVTSVTALPPQYVNPTACAVAGGGSLPGCTQSSLASPVRVVRVGNCYRAPPDLQCSGGAKGAWKFDVGLHLNLQPQFWSQGTMNLPSGDSPGLTLGEHEDLHKGDVRAAMDGVNSAIQTEGFSSRAACDAARANVRQALSGYYSMSSASSSMLRDLHP